MKKKRAKRQSDRGGKLVDFRSPPLHEVIFGVQFKPLREWTIAHIGKFWADVSSLFPRCEHAEPILDPHMADQVTGFPLPRIWFINTTDDKLLQLQAGRFFFNWRERGNEYHYPGFQSLFGEFADSFTQYRDFLSKESLGKLHPVRFDLTYVNHIYGTGERSIVEHQEQVVDADVWHADSCSFLPQPKNRSWEATFLFPEPNAYMTAKLRHAKRKSDQSELLILELNVLSMENEVDLENYDSWFEAAHERIVRSFLDITTEGAQIDLWGKK